MGQIDMATKLITVFGGSGFIGRHLVQALVKRGHRIRVAVRRPDLAGHLQPSGTVGQILPIQANLRHRSSVEAAVKGADAVINLVGILAESGKQSFQSVQAEGARSVARAAQEFGVGTLVQMSALGADPASPSQYAQSKARGEDHARSFVPQATIIRPSVVFGPEDQFFNQFAALARILPVLPLIGGGETRFQPVFVGDIAELIARVVDGAAPSAMIYELGGPRVMSFRQVLEYILELTQRKRLLLPLPFPVAMVQASFLELLPKPLLTRDQVLLLQRDSIVSKQAIDEHRTFEGLGMNPVSIEAVVPTYLYRFRKTGQFERQNQEV